MLRTMLAAGGMLLASPGVAQTVRLERVGAPVRDAGVYHVASGTWTRAAGGRAHLGAEVIYRADAPSGYFATGPLGTTYVDEGVLPGTGNAVEPGPQDAYRIDGFQFVYCAQAAAGVQAELTFYDSYVPCDDPAAPGACIHPVGSVALAGLPGSSFCWVVTVDLAGAELCMAADGGPCSPGYDGHATGLDHFGWSATYGASAGTVGPFVAGGDPAWAPEGDGTCYSPGSSSPCAAGATALGAIDGYNVAGTGGCFSFGGYVASPLCGAAPVVPFAQFGLLLFTDCSRTCTACADFVYCDGPFNGADISISGCSCAAGSLIVELSNARLNEFGYLLISATTAVVTNPPGALGDLCVAGSTIGRYDKDAFFTGASGGGSVDVLNAVSGGGGGAIPTIGGNLCSPAGQTWNFQFWHRDTPGPSRFSKALTVTFH